MKTKPPVAASPERQWTRPEDYVEAMARKRTARLQRNPKTRPRTQSDMPQAMLSTVPFIVLLGVLAVLSVAIMVAAWPGNQEPPRPRSAVHEAGTADKGWFQEAQKEMRSH